MMKTNHRKLLIAASLLLLAILACNAPGGTTEQPPTAVSQAEGGSPEPTQELTPADTPAPPPATDAPDVEGPDECTLNSRFVADVSVPDDTEFEPGESFTKVWRVANSGTCEWETGTKLVRISGDPLGSPASVGVAPTAPNTNVDLRVDMTAPDDSGTYRSDWQLEAPDGTRFGSVFYVQIVIPEEPTAEPTKEPTQEPTAEPTKPPTVEPSSDCEPVEDSLKPVLDELEDAGYDLGCAIESAQSVQGAFQEFWISSDGEAGTDRRNLMIWRSDEKEIYIIRGEDEDASEGPLMVYTDTWEEGDPSVHPDCEDDTPPSGFQLPIRGFGKIWCINELWLVVGWPSEDESQVQILVQPMQTGLLIKVEGLADVEWLVALDYRANRGWTEMIAP